MEKPKHKGPAHKGVRKERQLLPPRFQHFAAALVILVALVLFFSPLFFGHKTFLGYDAVGSLSWGPVLDEARAAGIIPLWNPYIFCGMPAYSNLTFSVDFAFYNISLQVVTTSAKGLQYVLGNHPLGYVIFYYLVLGLGMYALTFSKVNNKVIALLAGLGTIFSTYIIIWMMISHITKIKTMCWLPWIFLVIEKLRVEFKWHHVLLLILLFHFVYAPFHLQMIFYLFLMVGLYVAVLLVRAIRKEETWATFLRTASVVLATALLAVLLNADRLLTMYEYSKSSIRGAAAAVEETVPEGVPPQAGLEYSYATNWSFAPGEMMTWILPSWYGFGSHRYQRTPSSEQITANTYWGPQPFVDGPQYMGIVILLFAILGFVRHRKDPFVQFLGVTVAFSLLVSFGKEFPLVYNLMFEYFPMFNRFRVPSMILVLVQIAVPLLAAFGIFSLSQPGAGMSPQQQKRLKYVVIAVGALLLVSLVARGPVSVIHSSFFPVDDVGPKLAQALKTDQTNIVVEFYRLATQAVSGDFSIALGLIFLSLGSLYFYLKGSIRFSVLLWIILIISVADLWRVDINPMEPVTKEYQESIFATPEHVRVLQRDTTLYRTLTFVDGVPPQDNILAYWKIQNIFGYHPAKMRAYQDLVDAATLGNPLLLQLMNVKYIISNTVNTLTSRDTLLPIYDGEDGKLAKFQIALPRAFFVNRAETASGPSTLDKIATLSFSPTDLAYTMEDLPVAIDPPQPGAGADIVRFGSQDLELNVTATGNNLLFLSEVYYPSGWKAFLDGVETPIYRLDYLFRGVIVPQGTHKLIMKFDPESFRWGRNISLVSNILLLGGGLGFAGWHSWRRNRQSRGSIRDSA